MSDEPAAPLLSGLRKRQHRRTSASEWDALKLLNAFKKAAEFESSSTRHQQAVSLFTFQSTMMKKSTFDKAASRHDVSPSRS
jgi:hypothetical protein